ncbi:MAG: tetratricopeptide repeat protein [Deltaproteobacteria bacterium]|nr:tetratricopeptide repeat protein [Deltaproteobacteria bacterium]
MKRSPVIFLVILLSACSLPFAVVAAERGHRSYEEGVQALKQGDLERAISLLSAVIDGDSKAYRAYNDRGVAYKRLGRFDQALQDYTRALEIRPDYASALNNRGVLHLERGECRRAVEDLTLALNHGELGGKIYTNRGLAYVCIGERAKAKEDYRRAFSARPLDSRSFVFMAEALEAEGEIEKAVKMYQLALGVAPDPQSTSTLEKKIAALEKKGPAARQAAPQAKSQAESRPAGKPGESPIQGRPKEALPAPSPAHASSATKTEPAQAVASTVESLAALDDLARRRAVEKLPPEAATLYIQGYRFAKDSHFNKALVRHEEALQLARRNKNQHGMAWILIEIARAYTQIGENPRALPALERALSIFERLNASDEIVLTLGQLAQVSQGLGLKDKAEGYATRWRQKAASEGYIKLLGQVVAPGITTDTPSTGPGGLTPVAAKTPEPERNPSPASPATPHAPPAQLNTGAPASRPESAREKSPKPVAVESTRVEAKPVAVVRVPQPAKELQRQTFALKDSPGDKRERQSIEGLLAYLARLKAAGEEVRMIEALEQVAEAYAMRKNNDKAFHALVAAIGYREKFRLSQGMAPLLTRVALMRERRGDFPQALEDYARATTAWRAANNARMPQLTEKRARNLASKLGLDASAAVSSLERLWDARARGAAADETNALFQIAILYEAAGRHAQALNYFDRASASLLAHKAEVFEKLGKVREARDAYSQAIILLKKLDYSRYLRLIERSSARDRVSANSHGLPSYR